MTLNSDVVAAGVEASTSPVGGMLVSSFFVNLSVGEQELNKITDIKAKRERKKK
jgi:hypothetical protein